MKHIYIITGTSRGLGHALVEVLSKPNNELFCLARTINTKQPQQSNVHHLQCDLSDTSVLANIMDVIFKQVDWPSVTAITLINNAGVLTPIGSIHQVSIEDISHAIDVNLKGLIVLTSLFLKKTQILDIEKMVINISSGAATKPYDGWSVYCATKAGVDLFTRCVGLEQMRQKFPALIFSFYPSVMDTAMQELIRQTPKTDFPTVDRFLDYKSQQALLAPADVAKKLLDFAQTTNINNGGVYNIEHLS